MEQTCKNKLSETLKELMKILLKIVTQSPESLQAEDCALDL